MNKDNINIIVGIIAIAVIVIIAIKIFKPQNTETFRKFIQKKEYMDNVSFDETKEGNMNKLVNQKLDEYIKQTLKQNTETFLLPGRMKQEINIKLFLI